MDQLKIKQQVIEKIKASSKILVTVSDSPSVDALSAALGLTLLLDKQEKYATAIFSGETPPAIAFLEPEKTFDDTTDSLRDFIIALNKEKADHLRYKVEGDSVKIFITPYKTVIDESDLEFSQGDYNVELVIAIGVDNQENLDTALDNHGQILHDAEIITVTTGTQRSELGGIDWYDADASSLSEMIASLVDSFKDDKKKSLLDAPIASALLTGIVAETERFSNERTTSGAMTVAAKLMLAGADQQLIANELEQSQEIPEAEVSTIEEVSDEVPEEAVAPTPSKANDGGLSIDHSGETLADLDKRIRGHEASQEKIEDEKEALEDQLEADAMSEAVPKVEQYVKSSDKTPSVASLEQDDATPTLGGTLNATTEQAADDARREEANDRNRTILSHSYLGSEEQSGEAPQAPGSEAVNAYAPEPAQDSAYAAEPQLEEALAASTTNAQSFIGTGERVIQPLGDPTPGLPAPAAPVTPVDMGLPLPPPLPDFTQMGAAGFPADPAMPPVQQPELLGDILTQDAPVAAPVAPVAPSSAYGIDPTLFTPQPDAATFAPAPPAPIDGAMTSAYAPVAEPIPAPVAADPSQFQIPPQ